MVLYGFSGPDPDDLVYLHDPSGAAGFGSIAAHTTWASFWQWAENYLPNDYRIIYAQNTHTPGSTVASIGLRPWDLKLDCPTAFRQGGFRWGAADGHANGYFYVDTFGAEPGNPYDLPLHDQLGVSVSLTEGILAKPRINNVSENPITVYLRATVKNEASPGSWVDVGGFTGVPIEVPTNSSHVYSVFEPATGFPLADLSTHDTGSYQLQMELIDESQQVLDTVKVLFHLNNSVPWITTVPDLLGLEESAALAALSAAGLYQTPVVYEASAAVPAGQVLRQTPDPGTLLERDNPQSIVEIVVSTGFDAPVVVGLTDTPDPTVRLIDLVLVAYVQKGTLPIDEVEFYRESNGSAGLQVDGVPDDRLGVGEQDGYNWTIRLAGQSLSVGSSTYYALAWDNDDHASATGTAARSTANEVTNLAPSIASLDPSSASIPVGSPMTLTAGGVMDPDLDEVLVEFYHDSDGNSTFEPSIDELLGSDSTGADGYSWRIDAIDLPEGQQGFFARAVDAPGDVSAPAHCVIDVILVSTDPEIVISPLSLEFDFREESSSARSELESARATSGPIPSRLTLEAGSKMASAAARTIPSVPAYRWRHGCGPTALGMVLGYWNEHGFEDLLPGSTSTPNETNYNAIASSAHFNDYSLPLDEYPEPIALDLSEPPPGDEHVNDCVADFAFTSFSARDNYYGWGSAGDLRNAFLNYSRWCNADYAPAAATVEWSGLTYAMLKQEIDAGFPFLLLVDSSGDGVNDHFVAVIGYDETNGTYGCYNTYDEEVHWYPWTSMQTGSPFGIHSAIFCRFDATDRFFVSNLGTADLQITSITQSETADWLIGVTPPPPFVIEAGATVAVAVEVDPSLAPPASTSETVRLLVESNDEDSSPYPGGVQITLLKDVTNIVISGRISAADGSGLADIEMTGGPTSIVSDPFGDYSIEVPAGWSGTLVPTSGNAVFDPPERNYVSVSIDRPDQNFTLAYVSGIENTDAPSRLTVGPCSPNPFNPSTTIRYGMPKHGIVTAEIFDVRGRLVRTLLRGELASVGWNEVRWSGRTDDGRTVPAGFYFCRIRSEGETRTTRLTLVK